MLLKRAFGRIIDHSIVIHERRGVLETLICRIQKRNALKQMRV